MSRFTGNYDDDPRRDRDDAWEDFYTTRCECGARKTLLAAQCVLCDAEEDTDEPERAA